VSIVDKIMHLIMVDHNPMAINSSEADSQPKEVKQIDKDVILKQKEKYSNPSYMNKAVTYNEFKNLCKATNIPEGRLLKEFISRLGDTGKYRFEIDMPGAIKCLEAVLD